MVPATNAPRGRLRDLGGCLAIGLLGLALRLAYVQQFAAHPVGKMPWVDEGAYWTRALEIRAGRWLPDRPYYQDPLLPYVIAGLAAIVGPDVPQLRIALACLGALTPLAVLWAARGGLGRAEAIVAGLAAALYGPLVFSDGLIEKEGLAALVSALALGFTARATKGGATAAGSAGFAWGVLALLRSNALLVGPLGAAWMGLTAGEDQPASARGRRRRLALAAVFLFAFALALAPVAAVNASVGRAHEFLVTTWQMGANFYVGNGPEANGTYNAPPFVTANPSREADDFAAEAARRTGHELTPGQVSRFWLSQGLKRWRDDPRGSLALLAYKLGLVAHDFEIPDSHDMEFVGIVAAPALGLAFLSFGWLSPCVAVGLARANRSPFWWFLVLSTATGLLSTAAFFVVGRYRVPWTPGLLMLGAAGVVDLASRLRSRRRIAVADRVVLLMLPAAVLAWRPMVDPVPDRWGHMLIGWGLAEALDGHLEPAIDALDDARALGIRSAERVDQLLAEGPLHDAMSALIAGRPEAEKHPGGGVKSDLRLARWMRQFPAGRSQSRRILDRRLAEKADDRHALRESGAWWLGETVNPADRSNAVLELNRAAEGGHGDASAAIMLAIVLDVSPALPIWSPPASPARVGLARAIVRSRNPSAR
jgi:hypothetical protein